MHPDPRKSDNLVADFLENIGAGSLSPLIDKTDRKNAKALRREQALLLRALKRINVNRREFISFRDAMILGNEERGSPRKNGWVITRDVARMILRQWERDQPELRARFNLEYEVMRDIEELPVGDRFGETAADRLQQELATKCDERLLEKALESILRN